MVNVGIIGLGKMGMSHYSIINAHDSVKVTGVCDSSGYVLDVLHKYTGAATFTDFEKMLDSTAVEAVVISTPSRLHAPMVRTCLERGLHVFCEKPFCLDPVDSRALAEFAVQRGLVTQVGYHNRFVGAFGEVKRLLESGAIGKVSHALAEAYGPVVLKPKGGTWRSKKDEGGGALYDYAAHPLDLLTWYFGQPDHISGTVLGHVFSAETEDEVFTSLTWANGPSGQLSVSWSDESQRKMTTKVTIWGTNGRINVDRQECQVYLRDASKAPPGYGPGWNVRYTTELTEEVDFYVRGEEYSAQLNAWVKRIESGEVRGVGDFVDAAGTDEVLAAIARSKGGVPEEVGILTPRVGQTDAFPGFLSRLRNRLRARRSVRNVGRG
ncbi:Gfo/Idh/MocA family oxidoreductase [Nocardioides seonyuensis]|uniref:Gfo/Idh/MocA family oxidoreductase n=1 Tax=Nocardioides seonyuensis TaxID=2518371 RepID=A0A4P7II23_9ACTN|nr:Gfo/Idh/MocA family oxidoreductase [Nocardioides seonyuensis]QBX55867.1 Gfo/Idh/MocA family oxidoreductase [Nocardioides seonyuensis]